MSALPPYELITTTPDLAAFCDRACGTKFLGFDTEFVSENRFRPQLCLLQIATDSEYAIVDTIAIEDFRPFWEFLTSGSHVTLVHAAREEFLFCVRACGKWPVNLFDVQLAAGMVGLEYPSSYGNLITRLLGHSIDKGETRTDWARRPLSDRQIAYALQDVIHLRPMYDKLSAELDKRSRRKWLEEEMSSWQTSLEQTVTQAQWHRVNGITNLNRRALAIVRELWLARESAAENKNRAARRILPDDLIVELARRGTSDPRQLKAIRGFESRVSRGMVPTIAAAIEKANQLKKAELPERMVRNRTANLGLLGQFLNIALKIVCNTESISPAIVGSADDVRTMAAWRLGLLKLDQTPELSHGWRSEIVGQLVDRIIDGSLAIRVGDPLSEEPLVLE